MIDTAPLCPALPASAGFGKAGGAVLIIVLTFRIAENLQYPANAKWRKPLWLKGSANLQIMQVVLKTFYIKLWERFKFLRVTSFY
jgi:hypothetical protein